MVPGNSVQMKRTFGDRVPTTHSHTHTQIYIYIYTYIDTYIHTHIHTHTYIHTYIHSFIHIYRWTHADPSTLAPAFARSGSRPSGFQPYRDPVHPGGEDRKAKDGLGVEGRPSQVIRGSATLLAMRDRR